MLLGGNLWVFGELSGSLFCVQNGRFWVVDLQVDLQTGLAFFKNWTCKSGVKRITIAWVGKLPLLPLYVQETYPFSTSVFDAYTLLYIVYRGFLAYFSAFQGEGEHLRGVFGVYHLPGAGKMIRILEVGMKRGYSRRMIPLTRAMAWRYDFSSSNGGYFSLSETMQI